MSSPYVPGRLAPPYSPRSYKGDLDWAEPLALRDGRLTVDDPRAIAQAVAELDARDMSAAAIARQLGCSSRTVVRHRARRRLAVA